MLKINQVFNSKLLKQFLKNSEKYYRQKCYNYTAKLIMYYFIYLMTCTEHYYSNLHQIQKGYLYETYLNICPRKSADGMACQPATA